MESMAGETKMLGLRVPKELHRRLKILAATSGRPMQELVEEAIRDLLRKYGEEA